MAYCAPQRSGRTRFVMDSEPASLFVLVPWESVSSERAKYFEQELARELGPEHALFGRPIKCVALTRRSDDVLFQLGDSTFARVHLTYTRNPPEMAVGARDIERSRLWPTG